MIFEAVEPQVASFRETTRTFAQINGRQPKWRSTFGAAVTDDYEAEVGDMVRCDPTGAGFNVILPAVSRENHGRMISVKNASASANNIVVTAASGNTIDGSATVTLSGARECVLLVSDGVSEWMILAAI